MRFAADSLSEAGPRSENQDAVGIKSFGANNLAIAVADGLGGHYGGKVASELAVRKFIERVTQGAHDLRDVASDIHRAIKDEQQRMPENRSMATTLSAAVFRSGLMEFVHCGDTRIVVARNAGIRRLTNDHTEAQRLFAAGIITKSELANYPRRNVLESALGARSNPQIDAGSFVLLPGDKFFFTTDGFYNAISLRELFHFIRGMRFPADIVSRLSNEMNVRHPDDNFTMAAVVVLP